MTNVKYQILNIKYLILRGNIQLSNLNGSGGAERGGSARLSFRIGRLCDRNLLFSEELYIFVIQRKTGKENGYEDD